jgi:hypothetical protein
MRLGLLLVVTSFLASRAAADAAEARPGNQASFALIVGVNRSVDEHAPLLRYADDDAARYVELFRSLGARSYVLARLDENTRRLHPQVAAEALPPRLAEYRQIIGQLAADVARARQRGIETSLYFVYAGHGDVEKGRGYITLEDARLHGETLEDELLARVRPDQEHFIVDACHSYFLAVSRGPGGTRKSARGFSQLAGLFARPTTGLLFSTSSAKESHEWAGFQSGVFSHEVRSGLHGAADADGDGRISYREIAAFIQRANASVVNERYRSEVYAKPPEHSDVLVDLQPRLATRIDTAGVPSDHYLLEDERGVRFADFHNEGAASGYLIRPRADGRLYLRRLGDDTEVVIPLAAVPVVAADLQPREARITSRGAAHDAFESLFALPFGKGVVEAFQFPVFGPREGVPRGTSRGRWSTITGWGLIGVGALGAGFGAYSLLDARAERKELAPGASQAEAAETNERIRDRNLRASVGFAAAGAAVVGGLFLVLWPGKRVEVQVDPKRQQAMVGFRDTF